MKKARQRFVRSQETELVSGSVHSYENYVAKSRDQEESVLANPDILPEKDTSPSSPQQLMGEAIEHLQGRQKEVYLLVMREDKSIAEAGEVLDISKGTAQTYLDRAINFITKYCQEGISTGRV